MSKLIGLTLAAAVLLAASEPASAQQAVSAQGAAAIAAKRQGLRQPVLGYFTDATSTAPISTVQGGAYQFFSGASGRGMIIWKPGANGRNANAVLVYGPLLTYYLSHGRESGLLGFPTFDPGPAADEPGCDDFPNSTLGQVFNGSIPASQGGRLRFTTLCVQPNGSVVEGLVVQ